MPIEYAAVAPACQRVEGSLRAAARGRWAEHRAPWWAVMIVGAIVGAIAPDAKAQQVPPLEEAAPAGALAALPARGLAAAIAEAGRIEVPSADPRETVAIRATQAARWTEGSYDVWHLTGGVRVAQGNTEATAHEAVVWIEQEAAGEAVPDGSPAMRSMLVRMAGDVSVRSTTGVDAQATTVRGPRWTGRFWMARDPELDFASIVPPAGTPPIYDSPADRVVPVAHTADEPESAETPAAGTDEPILRTQYSEFGAAAVPRVDATAPVRRLRAFPRSSVPLNIRWFPSPTGQEWVAVITSGVNLVVDGVDPAGPLDISADRLVIWTHGQSQPDLDGSAGQSGDVPLELYMEGNVVFRQGQRVVEAVSMFY
ncbi:MAG: hypothetical protein ACKOTB_03600, partial [Planctomycetia bacterium]